MPENSSAARIPVYLQVGERERHEIGYVHRNPGVSDELVSRTVLADLLREAANHLDVPGPVT